MRVSHFDSHDVTSVEVGVTVKNDKLEEISIEFRQKERDEIDERDIGGRKVPEWHASDFLVHWVLVRVGLTSLSTI